MWNENFKEKKLFNFKIFAINTYNGQWKKFFSKSMIAFNCTLLKIFHNQKGVEQYKEQLKTLFIFLAFTAPPSFSLHAFHT